MAHTAQFLLCLVQEENDKVFCTKYSGHVQTQEALPTFNSNDVKPWDLYLSTNLFQIMLSSDTYHIFLLCEHRAATEKEFPPFPLKNTSPIFHFPLSAPSMSSMSIQPQIGVRRQRVDFMSFLPCFLSS